MRRLLLVFGLATVLAIGAAIGLVWYAGDSGRAGGTGAALVGGPFTLTNQHGQRVTEQDFAGRYMLVYFGYTYCPDLCPMSLSTMTAALDLLPEEQAEQVVPVFISVDPERDTVEQLAAYAPLFHPRLVALTGSKEEVAEAARAYRVYFHKAETDTSDYLVDHSSFIYLMGPDGKYRTHFGHTASPEEIAEALREQLAAGA